MKHHEFMQARIKCRHCGWQGRGEDMELGEVHAGGCVSEYHCPKCHEYYGAVPWPLIADYENGMPK